MPTSSATLTLGGLAAAGVSQVQGGPRPALSTSEVQYAAVSASALGHNTLVDAVADKRICVVALVLVASGGANTVQLQSGAGDITLSNAVDLVNDGQLVLPYQPTGWCETGINELLNLELSSAALVAGVIGYTLAG